MEKERGSSEKRRKREQLARERNEIKNKERECIFFLNLFGEGVRIKFIFYFSSIATVGSIFKNPLFTVA